MGAQELQGQRPTDGRRLGERNSGRRGDARCLTTTGSAQSTGRERRLRRTAGAFIRPGRSSRDRGHLHARRVHARAARRGGAPTTKGVLARCLGSGARADSASVSRRRRLHETASPRHAFREGVRATQVPAQNTEVLHDFMFRLFATCMYTPECSVLAFMLRAVHEFKLLLCDSLIDLRTGTF